MSPRPGASARRHLTPYLLLLPFVVILLVSAGYPLARQLVMSFQKFGLKQQFGAPPEMVGLSNYTAILSDGYFWGVFAKSLGFCLWTAGATMVLSLALALLLQRAHAVARTFFTSAMVVVWAMPLIASLTIFLWIFDPSYGIVDWLGARLGMDWMVGFNWFGSSIWTFYAVASSAIVWAAVPFATITIYSALTQVNQDVVEAAQIDGASGARIVREVVLPIIAPVITLITILEVIWDLRVFTQIHVLQQGGGIASQTNLLGTYIFSKGISQGDYGTASALSMIVLVLTLVITAFYLRQLWRGEE